jgi:major membrane immunogen (membrane-anchored lipoprotein)
MKRTLVAVLAAALLLAGCGGSDTPAKGKPVVVDIAVKAGTVKPQGDRVDVTVGQKVTLHITSDADEEIHVHSEPEHEYAVGQGDDVEKSFTIDTPGQVAVEAHHLDVTIVQLVVRP